MIDTAKLWFGTHRRWVLPLLLVIAAVLFGLTLAHRGEFQAQYVVPAAGHDANLDMAPPPVAPLTARPRVQRPPTAPVVTAPPPAPADVEAAEERQEAIDDAQQDRERIGRAIDHAVRKALRRGETVRWHKKGQEGFVMVSEPRDDGAQICRNVTATVSNDHGQALSNVHLWCSSDGGDDWQPR